jgi:endonuclease YncB( thermonuclease family)
MYMGEIVKFGRREREPDHWRNNGSQRRADNTMGASRWTRRKIGATIMQWSFLLFVGGFTAYQLTNIGDRPEATVAKTAATTNSAANSAIIGRATVVDGDTIKIRGQRIRFNGIDAPESNQRCSNQDGKSYACGSESAFFLDKALASSRTTRCKFVSWDRHGRLVGDCYLSDGNSVASLMVQSGHALDWPRYSGGAYSREQAAAKTSKLGLWRGVFEKPWEYRAKQRDTPTQQAMPVISKPGSGSCNIKGNISRKGDRIYHVPGQRHYDETRISSSKGERWFCSEDEATAAGWRPTRR